MPDLCADLTAVQAILKALDVDAQQASSAASSSLQAVQEGPGQLLEDFSQGLNHSLNQALPGLQESIDSTLAGFTSQVFPPGPCMQIFVVIPGTAAQPSSHVPVIKQRCLSRYTLLHSPQDRLW